MNNINCLYFCCRCLSFHCWFCCHACVLSSACYFDVIVIFGTCITNYNVFKSIISENIFMIDSIIGNLSYILKNFWKMLFLINGFNWDLWSLISTITESRPFIPTPSSLSFQLIYQPFQHISQTPCILGENCLLAFYDPALFVSLFPSTKV